MFGIELCGVDPKLGQQFGNIKKVAASKVNSGPERASAHIIDGVVKCIKGMKDRVGKKFTPWM